MKTTLILSTSQISEAFKCHHAWALAYRENLRKADAVTKFLDEGALVHSILEIYYNLRAFNPRENHFTSFKAAVEVFSKHKIYESYNIDEERFQFLNLRLVQYISKYSQSDLMPIVVNGKPAVEVGFSKKLYEDQKFLFVVESKLDLITKLNNDLVWVDHKTQQASNDLYKYSPQFLTYAWATGFKYGMINYIRTHQTYNDKYTLHKDLISFPDWLVKAWEHELIMLFMDLSRVLETFGPDVESEKFKRTRASCSGAFNKTPCMFTNICETQDLNMRESIKKFNYIKVPERRSWNY